MAYTDIPTQEVTLPDGHHVTMRLARTVGQEEAAAKRGAGAGSGMLFDLIEAWDLDDDAGVMPITPANVARLRTSDAVFLLNAFTAAQEARRADVDFTDISPTGPGANETTPPPALVSFPSTGSAGENSA